VITVHISPTTYTAAKSLSRDLTKHK